MFGGEKRPRDSDKRKVTDITLEQEVDDHGRFFVSVVIDTSGMDREIAIQKMQMVKYVIAGFRQKDPSIPQESVVYDETKINETNIKVTLATDDIRNVAIFIPIVLKPAMGLERRDMRLHNITTVNDLGGKPKRQRGPLERI